MAAEKYVIDNNMADVISQSFAAPEATFPSTTSLLALRSTYRDALAHHVTVVSATGDQGASGPSDPTGSTDFTTPVAQWPATDPLVTAVGGTELHLDPKGQRVSPDTVWNQSSLYGSAVAGGGGLSTVFARPIYQDPVSSVVGGQRGVPDVSMAASTYGAAIVYTSFAPYGPGFELIGGTSEATPLFAGVVAVADQDAGHPIGLIDNALYQLEKHGAPGIVDVTSGNNTVTFRQGGHTYTVQGYDAGPGYDLSSGVGTVNGAQLVPALASIPMG
jgi:subtilase family serine protease